MQRVRARQGAFAGGAAARVLAHVAPRREGRRTRTGSRKECTTSEPLHLRTVRTVKYIS